MVCALVPVGKGSVPPFVAFVNVILELAQGELGL